MYKGSSSRECWYLKKGLLQTFPGYSCTPWDYAVSSPKWCFIISYVRKKTHSSTSLNSKSQSTNTLNSPKTKWTYHTLHKINMHFLWNNIIYFFICHLEKCPAAILKKIALSRNNHLKYNQSAWGIFNNHIFNYINSR